MLKVGIIGIGNTGNQVASIAKERLSIPVIAINSSDKDLETIEQDIPKFLIEGKDGSTRGAGKDRKLAKKYLKNSIVSLTSHDEVQKMVNDVDICFVVSSTGGGTGSGTAPIMAKILTQTFPDTKIILVGVTPVNDEAYSSHVNTLEYLDELYEKLEGQTYMLYDNDKLSPASTYKILNKVNDEIISDIDVIRCKYNYSTKLDSIDDRDMMRLVSFPGRLVISRLEGFKETDCDSKTIEDMILDNIRRNCHVEVQRDKKVMASGIITNLSQALTDEFNDRIPKVKDTLGEPLHNFSHIYMNTDRKQPNNVFYIMAGLSPVNDKINKISDRIEELDEKRKIMQDDNALSDLNLSELTEKTADKTEKSTDTSVDLNGIFNEFDM